MTINLIGGLLERISCMSEENYDGIAGHTASSSGKLLKKYDQCLAVLNSTHVFFNQHYVSGLSYYAYYIIKCIYYQSLYHMLTIPHYFFQKNETRVMECFKKALKITDAQFNANPNAKHFHLYLAILNKFLFYFEHDDFTSVS